MEHQGFTQTSSMATSGLQGSRPHPLKLNINDSSCKIKKPKTIDTRDAATQSPSIVYVSTPKVFHTSPQEFMTLVQQLTGKPRDIDSDERMAKEPEVDPIFDPLVLTLGSPAVSPDQFLIFSSNMHGFSKELGSSC